jgi:DNA-binding beta-propeller fold protein YncE
MCVATVVACMKYGPVEEEGFDAGGKGLFVVNEGNFMYGNASLSYYDPETGRVENEVFARANGQKLGDVAQSMTLHGGLAWVVVNNSGVVFAIDPDTFKEVGRVTGFTSPRHIHFVSDTKAYVTQIWDSRICVINPKTYTITGYVETGMDPQSGSTEQMVAHGGFVYTNCWSYQNRLLKIDTQTDTVAGELVVGIQPASLVIDSAGKLWTLTDGGYEGSPYGHEAPALHRIDAGTFTIEKVFRFGAGDRPSELCIDGDGDEIYWIDRSSVWRMGIGDERMPTRPFIEEGGTIFYGLSVNPSGGEVYVADAIDHVQNGVVARYSPEGELIDTFKAGVSPGAFCWK